MLFRLVAFLSIVFFCKSIYSQSTSELDLKNGFKDFKLGDSYSKWKGTLVFESKDNQGIITYRYTGNCCRQMFDKNLDATYLIFKQGILSAIILETELFYKAFDSNKTFLGYRDNDLDNANDHFKMLFGKPSGAFKGDDGSVNFSWEGQKVGLISSYFMGPMEPNAGPYQTVLIYDKISLNKNIESGF